MSAPVLRVLLPAVVCILLPGWAHAQAPEAPPLPPAPEPVPAPETTMPAEAVAPMPPAAAPGGPTDHDAVVGRWGIEARSLGSFQRTPGNDPTCTDCPIPLNSLGVRRWHTSTYAWSAGLVLAFGGGSRNDAGAIKSWDTYLGVGPTVSASFLLTSWKHLAVSMSPQLDALMFMPRGSGSKTFLLNARGLVEGELHLGFIGLPELSVGVAGGLLVSYMKATKAATIPGAISSKWSVGFSGPQSLWGVVTNMYLRFYF